jgi:hypothetical protein
MKILHFFTQGGKKMQSRIKFYSCNFKKNKLKNLAHFGKLIFINNVSTVFGIRAKGSSFELSEITGSELFYDLPQVSRSDYFNILNNMFLW